MSSFNLADVKIVLVHQVHEIAEWFGFETRNKFQIKDENGNLIGYAAEQQKGLLGFLFRQYLGHWRRFDVHFFTPNRQLALVGHHPFRFFFDRIELRDGSGQFLGAIQKRFSVISKRFDVENAKGAVIMEVSSPIWKLWTFTFMSQGQKLAQVKKKWGGLFLEGFTDKDKFMVEFLSPELSEDNRTLVMASAVFIDLLYFEEKA